MKKNLLLLSPDSDLILDNVEFIFGIYLFVLSFVLYTYLQGENAQDRGILGIDASLYRKNEIRTALLKAMGEKQKLQIPEIAKALDGLRCEQRIDVLNN